jgi:serine phosphatase RsbU (regulator of sigma subunit)
LGIKAPQHYAENTVSVAPGDLLLLVSEGITGSVDASGASFGASGVMEVALGVAGDPAANILEAAKAYGRRGSFDNASVLCIHIS